MAYSCLFGFGRFRCFCGFCVWFFIFVLLLFLFRCWIVFGVGSCLVLVFFCFLGFFGRV